MNITEIRIRKIENSNKLRAVASITLDDEFVIHDIKIIEGDKGIFIAMPSRKIGENNFADIAHPIRTESRNELQRQILEAYQNS